MYQENAHITWKTHTNSMKCDLQNKKWGKQKVLAGHTVKSLNHNSSKRKYVESKES